MANGQYVIEKYLREVEDAWAENKFVFYSNGSNTMINKWQTYTDVIEEHTAGLLGLQSSPYYQQYQKQVEEWKVSLNRLQEILDTWQDVQKRWVYLQSVFSANQSIVQNYLSTVSEKLRSANQNFEQAINAVVEQPVIIRVLDDEHFIDRLNSIRDNLEQV